VLAKELNEVCGVLGVAIGRHTGCYQNIFNRFFH